MSRPRAIPAPARPLATLALAALALSAVAAQPLGPGAARRPDACELIVPRNQIRGLPGGAVSYTVTNIGRRSCPAFRVILAAGDAPQETLIHASLAAGASEQRTASTRIAGCAEVSVRVEADPLQQASEANESNNSATAAVAAPCPDLVPRLYATDEDGGLRYQVHVKVTNEGPVATPRSFLVLAGVTGLAAATPPLTEEIEPLAPGQSSTFSYGPKRLKINPIGVSVRADRGDWIEEANEDNNYATRSFGPQ
jgi:subtilase family serine protease